MKNVHCTACGQTFLTDTTEWCPLCRAAGTLVEPDSPAALKDFVTRKQQEAAPPQVRLVQAFVSGLCMTGLLVMYMVLQGCR